MPNFDYASVSLILVIFLERVLVVLRDGRTLIGFLRSVDQFGKNHLSISAMPTIVP